MNGGAAVCSMLLAAAAWAQTPQQPPKQPPQPPAEQPLAAPPTPPAQPEATPKPEATPAPAAQPEPAKPDPAKPEAPKPAPTDDKTKTPLTPPVRSNPNPDTGSPAPQVVAPVEGGETIEAVIYLKDGRRMTGFLVSRNEKETVLRIEGVNSPVPETDIERVEILPSIEDRYKLLKEAIRPDDTDRLLMLVQWLLARKQFDLALAELEPLVKNHPESLEARRLKTLVEQQRMVDQASADAKARRGGVPAGEPGSEAGRKGSFPTLSADDVNLIRVMQVDLDNPPRMVVPREMVDEMIRKYADRPQIPSTQEGREALYRKRPAQLLRLAFELKARELYGMARVQEDPKPMKAFRDDVWRGWVLNGCATARCHGGEEAGRLWLLGVKTGAEATVYTNFMILHQFKLADGTPLINYDKPAESPLLQLALRPESSKRPHPRVDSIGRGDKFRPIFSSPEDRRFQEALEWIKSMYVPLGRDYPVSYTPPVPASAKGLGTDGKKKDPGR